jgi:hypothetical protein
MRAEISKSPANHAQGRKRSWNQAVRSEIPFDAQWQAPAQTSSLPIILETATSFVAKFRPGNVPHLSAAAILA